MLNQLFLLIFSAFHRKCWFHTKSATFHENQQTRSICVYTCTIYTYMHHHIPIKNDIPSWPSLCTLWKTRSKWEICVESAVFVAFQMFSMLFTYFSWKVPLFIQKVAIFMKTNKIGSICVYTYTIYTYMYHQKPPKYNIYLVGFPSVLYETPGHNERSVLNKMFLWLFSEKCNSFQWKAQLVKSAVLFSEI